MAERLCLRCDWIGEADEPACPRCGAPLYRLGPPTKTPTRRAGPPAGSRPDTEGPRGSAGAQEDDDDAPAPAPAGSGRARVIVLALALVGIGFALALMVRGEPDPGTTLGQAEPGGPEPSGITFMSPTPVAPPEPTCVKAPSPRLLIPAETVPGPMADYRFQGSLGSSVGTAPDLIEIGGKQTAFTDEGMIGRTVLSFGGRTGLSLSAIRGVVSRTEYTIEILFRFDDVSGYRKIIDLKNGSRDGGLYVKDGCLTFFPRPYLPSTPIQADAYVQVVLTRGASDALVGYVNGIRQFVFDDELGIGEIGPARSLRFFVDDSRTMGEYSSGAVSQIRLYGRALSAEEVAALTCSEIRVPLTAIQCLAA